MTEFAARYDLSGRTTTYDYFTWQSLVQAKGATEIVFDVSNGWYTSKYPADECARRFDNFIFPGPALAGLKMSIGPGGVEGGTHKFSDLFGLEFRRLKSVLPPRDAQFTVTLRQTFRNTHRNSDVEVWRRFAKEIGARVIEDHSIEPISLYERMALYAGAKMNFGVTNGPMALLFFSEYPFAMFDCQNSGSWDLHGVKDGGQLPWFLPKQELVWQKPTLEALMAYAKAL